MPIYSFDIAKYILSIFVITIHSFGFIENNIENELARRFIYTLINTAVPVFFLMSGYLFFSKCEVKGYHWRYLGKFMSGYSYFIVCGMLFFIHLIGLV